MADRTHYDVLGIKPTATPAEVKAAYRKLVLIHHPDRSKDPKSPQIFIQISNAYEALADPASRAQYDEMIDRERRVRAEQEATKRVARESAARARTATAVPTESPRPTVNVVTEVARLTALFSRNQFAEAERVAQQIIVADPRQPIPYAVMGDIARSRGKLDEAARMYAVALQMDPRNALYLRRYEEVLDRSRISYDPSGKSTRIEPEERRIFALLVLAGIVLLAALYVAMSKEPQALAALAPVSTWTIGLLVMLFLTGVATGACLSIGNLLDRPDAMTTGRIAPTVALGIIAAVSFPAAAAVYGLIGLTQRGFNQSATRLVGGVGLVTLVLAIASLASSVGISPLQVMLWGGNLVYIGALSGWTVADSLRASR